MIFKIAGVVLAGALAYGSLVVWSNRTAVPYQGPVEVESPADLPIAGSRLTVLNWNLGYAGLGRESEFAPDGGAGYLPPGRELVRKNLEGIARQLRDARVDAFTLQEVTRTSPLNYWAPMSEEITALFPTAARVHVADLVSRYVPYPLRLEHGLLTLSKVRIGAAETVALPLETGYWLGFLKKLYALVVTRIPIAGGSRQWVLVNLHHAAYDTKASTRQEQVAAVLAFAAAEFAKGNAVILAGDWNMLLGTRNWPHKTEARHLEWAQPFPRELLSERWQIVIDPDTPTVRQLDAPYQPGRNFLAIIDGFIVSPNVSVEQVKTTDMGFAFSDHQPVTGTFALR